MDGKRIPGRYTAIALSMSEEVCLLPATAAAGRLSIISTNCRRRGSHLALRVICCRMGRILLPEIRKTAIAEGKAPELSAKIVVIAEGKAESNVHETENVEQKTLKNGKVVMCD